MRRPYLLWFALAAAALACWVVAARGAEACWTANLISVERVIDGDTFIADLQIFPKLQVTETIRVLGVDTPERTDAARWALASQFTVRWLQEAGFTEVTVCRYDSFGRALGKVVSRSKGELGAALIAAGHGVPFKP